LAVLLVTCLATALLLVDWSAGPGEAVVEGDVAPRTVRAPFTFRYSDHLAHGQAQQTAAQAVPPVFVYRQGLAEELASRVQDAFAAVRAEWPTDDEGPLSWEALPEAERQARLVLFQSALGVSLPASEIAPVGQANFNRDAETLTRELVARGMAWPIVADRTTLPAAPGVLLVQTLVDGEVTGEGSSSVDQVFSPAEAREKVTLAVLDLAEIANRLPPPARDAATVTARSLIRSNLHFDPIQTERRRAEAQAAVPLDIVVVRQGEILFRAGDVVNAQQAAAYAALQGSQGAGDTGREVLALTLLLLVVVTVLVTFGQAYLPEVSTRPTELAALGALLVICVGLTRLVVGSASGVAAAVGFEAEARSVWFLVPLAGPVMLVRVLAGSSWAVLFTLISALASAFLMELEGLAVLHLMLTGLAGAAAVEQSRERIALFRAGVLVGLFGAALALLLHFVQLFVVEGELSLAVTMRPVWSMAFALLSGLGSSFLVLGLLPAFESFGFVTDYRLMELANLNHPVMRQLMLKAPGTYHHSVVVGTLAEAACQQIGANALRAKVASYFHDVGKAFRPQYFVENQRDGRNHHDGLDPYASARILISHVTEGGRLAREHRLPQPIIDNIYMHHGTGLIQYFYTTARRQAQGAPVDEAHFRYPGPKPNTREAGVIMLADKVEAATRTLKAPTEHNIRMLISRIIASVMTDGQFSECPLTFREIHLIHESFVKVLVGIHHQRIEYPPLTGEAGRSAALPPAHALTTLELEPGALQQARGEVAAADEEATNLVDYEAIEHLPLGPR
jgi:hypothetical protein